MINALRKSEHDIDKILHKIRRILFTIEDNLPPVSAMFWYNSFIVLVVNQLNRNVINIFPLFFTYTHLSSI
ncbi:MAG: hypothetical protein D3903_17450 [Candidatus Electrothrix sp. GM3_4]|nr:hypothetical protein [Candidatus Electrothrix sp. GM3_4]